MTTINATAHANFSIFAWLRAAYANWQAASAEAAMIRATYTELSALSDRELNDLGLARADLRTIAEKSVRR